MCMKTARKKRRKNTEEEKQEKLMNMSKVKTLMTTRAIPFVPSTYFIASTLHEVSTSPNIAFI